MRVKQKALKLFMSDDSRWSNGYDCKGQIGEEFLQAFTQLFHFGEGEYEYIDTLKRSTDPTEVEAHFIYWHAAMFSGYGGVQPFLNQMDELDAKFTLMIPLFPVGAVCPLCHFSNDISDEFHMHSKRLAMTYCKSNGLEFTNENHAMVDIGLIFDSIRNGQLGDSFTYKCSACDFELEYQSLTQDAVDLMPIFPMGALDTRIVSYEGTEAELEEDFCWDDCVSLILLNNHYQVTVQ